MKIILTLYTENESLNEKWSRELKQYLEGYFQVEINTYSKCDKPGEIVFIDSRLPNLKTKLTQMDRSKCILILVSPDQVQVPDELIQGLVDDILVLPFRPVEVFGKAQIYKQILILKELVEVNSSFSDLLKNFREDLSAIEKLQKAKIPKKFADIRGFQFSSRYFSGLGSGGDYFDVAENIAKSGFLITLSNANTYGLSGVITSVLMTVLIRLSTDQTLQAGLVSQLIQKVYEELLLTFKDKDSLSLFFGAVSKETQTLWYLNFGNSVGYLGTPDHEFIELANHGSAIRRHSILKIEAEGCVQLHPSSRIVILSPGMIHAIENKQKVHELLNQFRQKPTQDLVNEFAFQVRSKLKTADEMPQSDCSILVIDADSRVLKLSKSD